MTVESTTGGSERTLPHARLIAAREIAASERDWSAARALIEHPSMSALTTEQRLTRLAVQQALYHVIELQGTDTEDVAAILEIFAESPEAVNATLGRIEMDGRWEAADVFERQLLGQVFDAGYLSIARLPRESAEAKIEVKIPAGLTREHGYVALARNRRLIIAENPDGRKAHRDRIEVDKVTTFALDIAQLAARGDDGDAAAEVRLIVASTIYKAIDWDTLRRAAGHTTDEEQMMMSDTLKGLQDSPELSAIMDRIMLSSGDPLLSEPDVRGGIIGKPYNPFREDATQIIQAALEDLRNFVRITEKYGMNLTDIHHRAYEVDNPAQLRDPQALAFIETALQDRSSLLTPAGTTYYVH